MRVAWLILSLMVLPLSLYAQTSACLAEFAGFGATGAAPHELIGETYDRLFDELGKKLSPEQIGELAESGNPFALPERLRRGSESLEKRLQEFEKMLSDRAWLSPAVRDRILTRLRDRSAALRTSAEKLKTAAARPGKFSFSAIEAPYQNAVSPDGKWLVHHPDADTSRKLMGRLVNLETGAVVPFDCPQAMKANLLNKLHFSADGKQVHFMLNEGKLFSVPFGDGTFDWANGRTRAASGFGDITSTFSPDGSAVSGWKHFGNSRQSKPYLKRTADGKAYLLELPDRGPEWKASSWMAMEDGKILVWWLNAKTSDYEYEKFDIKLAGWPWSKRWVTSNGVRLTDSSSPITIGPNPHFLPDGTLVTLMNGEARHWPDPQRTEVIPLRLAVDPRWGRERVDEQAVEGYDWFVLTRFGEARSEPPLPRRLIKVDLRTGEQSVVATPPTRAKGFRISPGGKQVIFEMNRSVEVHAID